MSGVKVSFEELGVKVSGVKVPLGSKCPGVKVSLGSKCPWGQSVFGVKMSVGSKCLWGQNGCEPICTRFKNLLKYKRIILTVQ